MIRVGVDVGGTFTDIVAIDDGGGRWEVLKVPSTPADPSVAVLAGLRELLRELGDPPVAFLGHGTTAGTNAFLTRRGATTALLATAGFEDVLEFRRMDRGGILDPYDLQLDFPTPLVPGRRRIGVRERIGRGGEVVLPLTDDEVERVVARLRATGATAVAISLLWSFEDPEHELRLVDAVTRQLPDVYVSSSVHVDPDVMEYERTSTTVINAYIGPLIHRYMSRLDTEARRHGLPAPTIMQSNGGMTSISGAIAKPVTLLESGPAGGVAACTLLAAQLGVGDALAVDMGGTSFDAALILDGEPQQVLETDIEGYAVRVPMLDIRSIGAGGGSLAWVDEANGLRVGPDSAGADPGPVCYGRGGARPTVTDASVALGYLRDLAGGRLQLDADGAARALVEHVGEPLGLDLVGAASGVHRIVDAHMADAMREIASERGVNPSALALIAYGGAGPIHASALARELDIARTIVPPHPGAFSALGVATSDLVHDFARAVLRPVEALDLEDLERTYAAMEREAHQVLLSEGADPERVELRRYVVARYIGQLHHLDVPVVDGALTASSAQKVAAQFHERHEALFGFSVEDESVFVMTARLRAIARVTKPRFARRPHGGRAEPVGVRAAWFPTSGFVDCPVYDREAARPGLVHGGPSIVVEYDSTSVVLPGQRWQVDASGAIVIDEA